MSRSLTSPVDAAFTLSLPKSELHAHLTGSITPQRLHEMWTQRVHSDPHCRLGDPLEVLSSSRTWNISTFFPLFSSYIYTLCSTRESIIYSTNSVLQDFKDDGVVYLELRTTPRSSESVSKEAYVALVLDCIEHFPHRDVMHTFLILSIDRRNNLSQALEVVDLALKYRSKGIVGIDLCGDPTKGDVSVFAPAFVKAKQHGLKVTLHFAEVPASSTELELETLLGFGPDRVGHVVCVEEGGQVVREIERKGVGVELCVSCNVQAGMTEGGIEGHHFGWWWRSQGAIALCTDDVGIFGSPLSNEYHLVAKHFGLSQNELVELSSRAIGCIFGGEDEKERLRSLLDKFRHQCCHLGG
ncbi:hypothetical protein N7G274_001888 [Stereocaulon virgatum]|uniref:Adenosine deaminase domain-containing protein n=1 Tax=Stereocaulon virgatum TaxID=373712 RepID=A0ABR4ANS0_9LECA